MADYPPILTRAMPRTAFVLLVAWIASTAFAHGSDVEGEAFFEKHVRPILAQKCLSCHGAQKQWAGLRLDSAEAVRTGGESGPAVVAGKPDESQLFLRVSEKDVDLRMPPEEEGEPLTEEQVRHISQWIESGAPWPKGQVSTIDPREAQRKHWAFQPIHRPVLPPVKNQGWPRNQVDRFLLAKLETAGLPPSPLADRRTLIRRATYDLTGMPPTPEETAAFVADGAEGAYAALVDRLLASPRYGEQWGRYWLDVARYSDTKGYVYGREERNFVHSSLYRDWVVQALNDDLPYDRFVLLQLAADQVESSEPRDLAAMGFVTLGRRFLGVTHDIIDDRIDVVGRGLLGLTVGCARCHDHKYDPIPTADYYSLYGVFQNCTDELIAVPQREGASPPSPEFQRELAKRKQKLSDITAARRQEAGARIRLRIDRYLSAQLQLDAYPELAFNQLFSKEDLIPATVRRWEAYLLRAKMEHNPIFVPWWEYMAINGPDFAERASEVTQRLRQSPEKVHPRVASAFATPPNSLAEVATRYQQLFQAVDVQWVELLNRAKAQGQSPPPRFADPSDEALRQVLYGNDSPCVIPDEPIINTEPLWDFDTIVELWQLQSEVDRWILQSPEATPHVVVLADRQQTTEPRIFRRGNPALRGDVVPRQFLSVIAGPQRKPFAQGSGRLELAQAIVDPRNPLTARVWVNRVWMHHFGRGLVNTPSDFGLRAEAPSHPELLDWLADEFMRHGWSNKWLHRTIMLSAAYQQSSRSASTEQATVSAEVDPENRLISRMNVRRLSFEQLRDTLLCISNELDEARGGPAAEMFTSTSQNLRRSIYGRVDRQYLPSVLQNFDFANPDLHTGARADTTSPQQALFVLNSPLVADRARATVKRLAPSEGAEEAAVGRLYEIVLQRSPSSEELARAIAFLRGNASELATPTSAAWAYGYGEVDQTTKSLKMFQLLPHFDGNAWQGGPAWPDATLGWLQLTAVGGHPGNDAQHAVVRRWTAPTSGIISLRSELVHQPPQGNGVRYWVLSNRHGELKSGVVHHAREIIELKSLKVDKGEILDFVVDVNGDLGYDQFLWSPELRLLRAAAKDEGISTTWDAANDFPRGTRATELDNWQQLTQALLMSNELLFVD